MKKTGETLGKILIPMVTPFKNGSQDVDYDLAQTLADRLITSGSCDSLVIAGTTGEFNTLENDERIKLFAAVREAADGRVPLIAGTGAASTRSSVMLTRAAYDMGYQYAMVVAPYYCKPCQDGIYAHYKAVAEAVPDMEIILYNIPIFTGVNVSPGTVAKLSMIPNIRTIKDEAGLNPTQMTEFMRVTPDDFTVYNGDDIMILCGLSQGAAGVVSGGAHIAGKPIREMIDLFLAGKLPEAQAIHHRLDKLFKGFTPNGRVNPIPVLRAAIELAGIPVGDGRCPLYPATASEREGIGAIMQELGLL